MRPTIIILAALSTLPSLAGAFNVQMNTPIVRPQASPLRLSVEGGLEPPMQAVIRDSSGHRVANLQTISDQDLVWDGRDASGKAVKPGSYFVEVESGAHMWSSVVSVSQ